ncbi:MAG: ABC transporter permease [Bifidobacteriaceae bacterium]|jgi:ABC-2 type transport system permease protein|nr:ABC transporter permease [Bifidobacteriaceae bacterium]
MFSKTIFKQTLRSNWKLWAVFTALSAAMSAVVIAVYDPKLIQTMMNTIQDMPGMADMLGDRMGGATSLLGMLGSTFYGMQGVILPLVFVIMTANSLVVSQVDRGSMAYTLSAPIRRAKVVATQALYLAAAVFAMCLAVVLVGLGTVQVAHHGLWGEERTADVAAAAETLGMDEAAVADGLGAVRDDPDAVAAGAEARGVDEDVYEAYLALKLAEAAYQAGAEVIGVEPEAVSADPGLILGDDAALAAAADAYGVDPPAYAAMLEQVAAQEDGADGQPAAQEQMMAGIVAAAEALGLESADLVTDLGRIKADPRALAAAQEASGLPAEAWAAIINQQLAGDEVALDQGIAFDIGDYLLLNLGWFLLMFCIAGISFLFSCVFNLTKYSLAFGAGIPIACLILQIMSEASTSLENLKYLSLNTLFSPASITGHGTFAPQFAVLAALGAAVYLIGVKVFKEKDLPL